MCVSTLAASSAVFEQTNQNRGGVMPRFKSKQDQLTFEKVNIIVTGLTWTVKFV